MEYLNSYKISFCSPRMYGEVKKYKIIANNNKNNINNDKNTHYHSLNRCYEPASRKKYFLCVIIQVLQQSCEGGTTGNSLLC